MKRHTTVLLLCISLAVGGLMTAGEKAGPSFYENGVVKKESDFGRQDADAKETEEEEDYIKWVEFNVTCEAMKQAYQYDLDTYGKETHLNWVELLAILGAKYGGEFSGWFPSIR